MEKRLSEEERLKSISNERRGDLLKQLHDQLIIHEQYCDDESGVPKMLCDAIAVSTIIELLIMVVSSRNVMDPDSLIKVMQAEIDRYSKIEDEDATRRRH